MYGGFGPRPDSFATPLPPCQVCTECRRRRTADAPLMTSASGHDFVVASAPLPVIWSGSGTEPEDQDPRGNLGKIWYFIRVPRAQQL